MKGSLGCCGMSVCTDGCMPSGGTVVARVPQGDVAGLYDGLANFYDLWGRFAESRARSRAIELANVKDGQSILEVAVGTGLAFAEIVKRNPQGRNLGIDLSEGMLEKARKRLQKFTGASYALAKGTAFDLPPETGSIDLLVNNYMFDLLSEGDMDRALTEFKRVLKKGGKLVLVNMTEGETAGGRLYEFLYRLSPRMMGGCRGVRLADKLTQLGFHVETREYIRQMLFPSEVIVARA